MKLDIHIDGGSRGNPGPAGAGVVIHDDAGRSLHEAGYFLGRRTNNQAEYGALIRALTVADEIGATEVRVQADSELLVRQVNAVYRVKNPGLQDLYADVAARLRRFSRWSIGHVYREANARADELANLAMDAGHDVIEVDARSTGTQGPKPSRKPKKSSEPGPAEPVTVRCARAPADNACPAPCRLHATLAFGDTVPDGVCLHVARDLIDVVVAVRGDGTLRVVECPHGTCRARFEARRRPRA